MLSRLTTLLFVLFSCASLHAGEISGQITDDQGVGLKGVRLCLFLDGAAPGDCRRTLFSDKNGNYAFKGLPLGSPFGVKVETGASLKSRKADPYPHYAWFPVNHEVELESRSSKVAEIDFTGTFSFSNFQAEFHLTAADFPELAGYDLVSDYVFLKLYTTDAGSPEQNLIFLGQLTDSGTLLIEVSVPLSANELLYEIYSLAVPAPVLGAIALLPNG